MDAVASRNAVRPLGLLGISAAEERAYRALLQRHMATVSELAGHLHVTPRVVRRLLGRLQTFGFATCARQVPRVYVAVPPEFAVAALVRQRQAKLERVRAAIPDLEAQSAHTRHANGHGPILEQILDAGQLGGVMAQMYKSFRSDVMGFQRAPILAPTVVPPSKLRPGMRVRTVSDDSVLAEPGLLAQIRGDVERGEQARTVPTLPFKMMIFDRRAGVVSVDGGGPTLLIHRSALLDALCALFEFVWEHATPIMLGHASDGDGMSSAKCTGALADELVPLLAAGLNDKAIALELGISSSTLNRRMSELMRINGTRTRFQLGWHAALHAATPHALPSEPG